MAISYTAYYALSLAVLIVSNYAMTLGLWWVAASPYSVFQTPPDMTTLLRLPHMDIVLAPEGQANPRRSDRIRNLSQPSGQDDSSEGLPRREKRRRRYNSVMEEDIDDTEELEPKRREPEHRRLNRLRLMKQNENVSWSLRRYWASELTNDNIIQESPVTSPEDNPAFSESLNKEKTLVEILLRKYGFGQWKPPLEVGLIVF